MPGPSAPGAFPHWKYLLKLLRVAEEEPAPWPILRGKHPDGGAIAKLIDMVEKIDHVETQGEGLPIGHKLQCVAAFLAIAKAVIEIFAWGDHEAALAVYACRSDTGLEAVCHTA